MGLRRINDNSVHIGLGGDFPSKEVKYFINIISFILLNFLWCGIYYSQLPDGQLTAEKCMIFPKAHDGWVSVCSVKRALMDWVTHSFACPLGHSTGNVENPFWVGHCTQDTRGGGDREEWSLDRHGGEKTKEVGTTCYEKRERALLQRWTLSSRTWR